MIPYGHGPTVIAVGSFGAQVAARLPAGAAPAGAGPLVLAGQPDPDLIESVEAAAFRAGRPWLPVVLEQQYVRCGPVVTPGRSACHRCFELRRRQHAGPDAPTTGVRSPAARGWAGHHVALAAALATRALAATGLGAAPATGPAPAWVTSVHLASGTLVRAEVLAVHGCRRCRAPGDPAGRLAELARQLNRALDSALDGAPDTATAPGRGAHRPTEPVLATVTWGGEHAR